MINLHAYSQISGNQSYKGHRDSASDKGSFFSNDSTLVIYSNILLNQNADKFKLALGVNQEGKTPKECLEKINKRINSLISKLPTQIKKQDIYVDFISQTRIYDFETTEKSANEILKGFEVKKNIIITVSDLNLFEQIIAEASEYQIYDIIKVDYINDNVEAIQKELLDIAKNVADKKKDLFISKFNRKTIGNPRAIENFTSSYPKDKYKNYEASESSRVDSYSSSFIKKEARKNQTFYYEGVDCSGFDKIINEANPEIGIQYVLSLSVIYDLVKNK